MTVIARQPRTCGRDYCTASACFCCSPPVPWENDERNPAAMNVERCVCITISGGVLDVKKGCPVHAPVQEMRGAS